MDSALLAPWSGPHGGLPPFDAVTVSALEAALDQGMDLARAEVAAIAQQSATATFANTLVALERAGLALDRARRLLDTYTSSLNDAAMQGLEGRMRPKLAAFDDELVQNAALFTRIQAVHDGTERVKLDAEQRRLVDEVHRAFVRAGAALQPSDKARLKEVNQYLAGLYTQFSQNLLKDESDRFVLIADAADLVGLPESFRSSAHLAAKARGAEGWLIANTRSSVEPFLTYAAKRTLREQVWRMYVQRGEHAGPQDNRPLMTEILTLRHERSRLLGFASYAHWATDDGMAKTPEAAQELMMSVWRAATVRAREEVRDMQAFAAAQDRSQAPIEPWDYRYYAEKVRKAKFDVDGEALRPYLQLNNMRDALFWCAEQLYGFAFTRIANVPIFHPDVEVYVVMRQGTLAGLWYFDPYARDGKNSGAWMSEYRTQEHLEPGAPVAPIVSNNANFVRTEAGKPVLISWDDALTLFHEFGHALHGLASKVRYPRLAGTNVARDFVEFPSQLNEHWLSTPEVLQKFALHCDTGEPLPVALRDKLDAAKTFNQGFATVEYLAAALYDMAVHSRTDGQPIDPSAVEQDIMRSIDCPREIVMRHRPTQFAHIFSGGGYAAGYYAYIWAETLTADAAEAFAEAGSFFDPGTATRLLDHVLSVGNSVPPEVAFRSFRGRDVDTAALMRDRGLA